jgi:D-alanine-D-alanine ligase
VIKACSGGSSIGVFVAKTMEEFDENIKQAFEFDDRVVVEKFIENAREFNVAVIGDKNKQVVSEVDEPIKDNEILTFADKYLGSNEKGVKLKGGMDSLKKKFPADISTELSVMLKDLALDVFKILGLKGIVRIDFLYDEKDGKVYICEVNAVPGSLAYYFFAKNRVVTNSLIERLVEIAHSEDFCDNLAAGYMTNILDEN